jgi:hypothetical protein
VSSTPTQVRRPWRAVARTVFQALVALAAMLPVIYQAATADDPAKATGAAGGVLVIAAGLTRVMALPGVNAWLAKWAPFLAAEPKAPPAAFTSEKGPEIAFRAHDGQQFPLRLNRSARTTRPFPLGRVVEHDPRSLAYPAEATLPIITKTWRHYGAVLDQGRVGSCTGNAMAQAVNTRPLHVPPRILTETDALALYGRATVLDGYPGTYPPDDTGSSGLAVAKAAREAGYITAYSHAFGLDHALAALMHGPLIVGTDWHEDMFTPDAHGFVRPTGAVAGGHEYVLLGVDPHHKVLTFLNSWSASWGVHGRFRMTFADFDTLLREQGDVILPRR